MNREYSALALVAFMSLNASCSGGNPGEIDPGDGTDPGSGLRGPVTIQLRAPLTGNIVGFGATVTLVASVRYRRVADGNVIPNRLVSWRVEGGQGSSVSSSAASTDSQGLSTVNFVASSRRTTATIIVETQQNDGSMVSDRRSLTIQGAYQGDLLVEYQYAGARDLGSVDTKLHLGTNNCRNINFSRLPPSVGSKVAASPSNTLTFKGLPENSTYMVTAVVAGRSGRALATGCVMSPKIVEGAVARVLMPLALESPKTTGEYEFGTTLKITDPLSSGTAQTIDDFEASMGVAGQHAVNHMIIASASYFEWLFDENLGDPFDKWDGDLLVELAFSSFIKKLSKELSDPSPAWLSNAKVLGQDLKALLSEFGVSGRLSIDSVDGAGGMKGRWDWTKFTMQWSKAEGCDPGNQCCGRRVFSARELGLVGMGANINGKLRLRRSSRGIPGPVYDLTIAQSRMSIQYGNLIRSLLNTLIMPEAFGDNSLYCAVEGMFGCRGGGDFVCGAPSSTIQNARGQPIGECGCSKVAYNASNWMYALGVDTCRDAVQEVADGLEDQILSLAWNGSNRSYLLASARFAVYDGDQDLQTDTLMGKTAENDGIFGEFVKVVPSANAAQVSEERTSFSGDILGDMVRAPCTSDDSCALDEVCTVRVDLLDECKGRQVCIKTGTGAGPEADCAEDTECATGVCLNGGKCFRACVNDYHCPIGLSCGTDAGEVSLSESMSVSVNTCVLDG